MNILGFIQGFGRTDTVGKGRDMLERGKLIDNTAVSEQTIPDDVPGVVDDVTDDEEDRDGN